MRRRDFIKVIAGSAATLPFAARAQQQTLPVIGYLSFTSPEEPPGTSGRPGPLPPGRSPRGRVLPGITPPSDPTPPFHPPGHTRSPLWPFQRLEANGQRLVVMEVGTDADLEATFASLQSRGVNALLVTTNPFYEGRRSQIVTLAKRHSVPVLYPWREYVTGGGLISYGTNFTEFIPSGWPVCRPHSQG